MLSVLRHELTEEAEKHRCNIHDLACTLLLAAVSENRFLLAHIGDGVIGYLDGDTLKVASVPDNGEFANETTFVTSDKAAETMRLFKGRTAGQSRIRADERRHRAQPVSQTEPRARGYPDRCDTARVSHPRRCATAAACRHVRFRGLSAHTG